MHLLIIRQRKDAVHILKIVFHKHLNIRKLILKGCWLGESSNGLLANIVDLYPDLDGLSLVDRGPLTPASYGLIPRLKKISELELSDWEVNYLCVKLLETHISICEERRKIHLEIQFSYLAEKETYCMFMLCAYIF